MAHDTLAPWAQKVEGVGPMTADELLLLPDENGWQHELVDGVLVKMPGPGYQHGKLVARLMAALTIWVDARHLGDILGADTGFILSQPGQPDTVLGPDIAFVRADRAPLPGAPGIEKYQRLAPDLAVEIASPSQRRTELAAKARLYLGAGVRLVWVIWPESRTVDVWRPESGATPQTLTAADALDGAEVIRDLRYPLAELFA